MKDRRQDGVPKGGLESKLQQIQMRWEQRGLERTPPDAAPETSRASPISKGG